MSERLGANFSIDITQLQAGLKTANKLIRESESQFKAAAAGMGDWTKRQEGLEARLSSLRQQITLQQDKVRALSAAYQKELAAGMDEASDRAIQLRTQINNEQAALERMKKQSNDTAIALSNFGDEAEEAGKDAKKSGDDVEEASGKFEKFGDIAKTAGKLAGAALAAIGTGVVALTKSAVQSYAEYEQLVGGVDTLFKDASGQLQEYAANAYKTAGMSANDYMQNVTSFSASLISSLDGDTKKAADAADRTMTAIADNANKMGTDMQSIVDTYQSLSRGNYQMLDNLKLGYGGTKTEMERLIADANKVKQANGEMADLSISSFADMTEAIYIIQREMGISGLTAKEAAEAVANGTMTQEEALAAMGTTAKEASTTISGSLSSAKSAWSNLLTGIADDTQDFDLLIDNFVDSVGTAAENLLPRVSIALGGIVKLVEKLMPQIPPLIEQFLPVVVEGVMKVTEGVVEMLPSIVDTILQVVPQLLTALIGMLPTIVTTVIQLLIQIMNALSGMLPDIVNAIIEVVPLLVDALVNSIPQLMEASITLLMAIIQAIPIIIQKLIPVLPTIINAITSVLIQNMGAILQASVMVFMEIIKAIPVIIPELIKAIPNIISAMFNALTSPEALSSLAKAGEELIKGLWNGISNMTEWIGEKIRGFGDSVLGGLKKFFGIASPSKVMANVVGKNLALGIGKGFEDNIKGVNDEIQSAMNFESPTVNVNRNSTSGEAAGIGGRTINVYQTNNYSQAHSRYEIYKSKQETAAAVRLAMATV